MISTGKVRTIATVDATITNETLAEMVARAQVLIETYTRRYFGLPETVTEYIEGNGNYNLRLSELPIPDVGDYEPTITVFERMTPDATSEEVTLFELRETEQNTAVLRRIDGAVWGLGYEYAVTYRRGYDLDHGPRDIEQLIIDLLGLRMKMKGHEGMRSETIAGYSYTRFGDEDFDAIPGAADLLDLWRRKVYA